MFAEIRDISYFSTDSRGDSDCPEGAMLLELNPGEYSDLVRLGSQPVSDYIIPYVQQLTDNSDVVSLGHFGAFSDDVRIMADAHLEGIGSSTHFRPQIMIPDRCTAKDTAGTGMDRAHYFNDLNGLGHLIANANPLLRAVFGNKAFMAEIMQDAGVSDAFPLTGHYFKPGNDPGQIETLARQVCSDFKGEKFLVLKPIESMQGHGILIVKPEDLQDTLNNIFLFANREPSFSEIWGSEIWSKGYWSADPGSIFQIQAFHPGTIVESQDKQWDATTRILWSAVHGITENGQSKTVVEAHAGFYKLPKNPLDENSLEADASQMISESSPGLIRKQWKKRVLGVTNVVLTDAQLEAASMPLRTQITGLLHHVNTHSFDEIAENYAYDQDGIRHELGLQMLAKHKARDMSPYLRSGDRYKAYGVPLPDVAAE